MRHFGEHAFQGGAQYVQEREREFIFYIATTLEEV